MSQLSTTCDVTNASPTITFPIGTDLSGVLSNDVMIIGDNIVPYFVSSVNDGADTITLTGNYLGETTTTGSGTGTSVVVHRSYTTTDSIPYTEIGDIKNLNIFKIAIINIQKMLSKFKYTGNAFEPATSSGNTYSNLSVQLGFTSDYNNAIETTSTTYVKVAEFTAQRNGGFYVEMLVGSDGTYDSYGRIYKNGVPYGSENISTVISNTTFYETLYFTKGDLVQLYLKTENAATSRCFGRCKFWVLNEDYERDALIYRRDVP